MQEFDAVVSGGGVIGYTAAHTLAAAGYQTLLVSEQAANQYHSQSKTDLRQIALAPVAIKQLESLGVDLANRYTDILRMHVWELEGSAHVSFSADEMTEPALAHVVQQQTLEFSLSQLESDCLTTLHKRQITTINDSQHEIELDNRETVRTNLLVVAEGARSKTRSLLDVGFGLNQKLDSKAIATVVQLEGNHNNTAWQVFAPTPLALLPSDQENLMSIIWSLPNEEAERVSKLNDEDFLEELRATCEQVCGGMVRSLHRVSFPLSQHVVSDFNPRSWVLLLGDTARTVHPLAGQGTNLGLEDVRSLQKVLDANPASLSQRGLWRTFAEKRKIRSLMMTQLMSFFSNVYASSSPYLRLLRNTGVRMVHESVGLKRQIIKEAMGIGPIAETL